MSSAPAAAARLHHGDSTRRASRNTGTATSANRSAFAAFIIA
jgi:hypothetical protein